MTKVAIITGGSRGLGAAMTRKLGEMGYAVVANYHSDSSKHLIEKTLVELKEQHGVAGLAVQADVSKADDCKRLVDTALAQFGDKIDVLVNNAGITNNANFIDLDPASYQRVIDTNLMSVLHMTHFALPHMVDHDDYANIISISSVGGLTGVINQGDYCASKAGVIVFSRAMALEFAGRHVRVNTIAPGMIMTDMLAGVNQDELGALSATIPTQKIGKVEDISGCMEYLIRADYMTGQVVSPNGGFVLQ
jgi:3-oxoacyl-[acyl-carrier protein] reductase